MLNNITNFFNLVSARRIKTTVNPTDLVALGIQDPRTPGIYQPAAISATDLIASATTSWGDITGTLSAQTDLNAALNIRDLGTKKFFDNLKK